MKKSAKTSASTSAERTATQNTESKLRVAREDVKILPPSRRQQELDNIVDSLIRLRIDDRARFDEVCRILSDDPDRRLSKTVTGYSHQWSLSREIHSTLSSADKLFTIRTMRERLDVEVEARIDSFDLRQGWLACYRQYRERAIADGTFSPANLASSLADFSPTRLRISDAQELDELVYTTYAAVIMERILKLPTRIKEQVLDELPANLIHVLFTL